MTDNGGYPDPVFNPAESACVIIGVDSYTTLPQLPAVRNNLKALRAALTDRTIGGMPKRNCRVVLNPRTITAALRPVEQAVHTAKDTLIVYYAGHGFLDSKQEGLYLTLPGTEAGKLHSGIPYAWLRSVLGTRTPPRLRIVILDCCYSGSVIKGCPPGRWPAAPCPPRRPRSWRPAGSARPCSRAWTAWRASRTSSPRRRGM